jgi:hypothetical protein
VKCLAKASQTTTESYTGAAPKATWSAFGRRRSWPRPLLGTVLEGTGFGATGHAVGEVCFNTAMAGYDEILTDPSYAGQIITFTFPHIGNVGTNEHDIETINLAATPSALIRRVARGDQQCAQGRHEGVRQAPGVDAPPDQRRNPQARDQRRRAPHPH